MRLDSIIVVARLRTSLFSTLLCRISLSRNYIVLECSFFPPFCLLLGVNRTPSLFFTQSGASRGEETSKDVQREEEARQIRRYAGRGSEQARASGSSYQQFGHYHSKWLARGNFPSPFSSFFFVFSPLFPPREGKKRLIGLAVGHNGRLVSEKIRMEGSETTNSRL